MNRVREWTKERANLKIVYLEKGITTCEIKLEGCMGNFGLSFAHREKRIFYYDKPGLLGSFDETVLSCAFCHSHLETDKELTKQVFLRLRGNYE